MDYHLKYEIDLKIIQLKILKEKILFNQIKKNAKYLQYLNYLNTSHINDTQQHLYLNNNTNINTNIEFSDDSDINSIFTEASTTTNIDTKITATATATTTIATVPSTIYIKIYSSFDIPFKIDNIFNSIQDIREGIGLSNKKYLAHNTIEDKIKVITYNIQNKDKKYDTDVNNDYHSKKFSPEHKNMIRNSISSIWPKLNISNNSTVIVMMVDENINKFRYTFFRVYTKKNFISEDDINNVKYIEWQKINNII